MKNQIKKQKSFFSEFGQDEYISELLTKIDMPKTLMEAGAFDPVNLSNSRYFINSNWQAVLIEPNSIHFNDLLSEYKNNNNVKVIQSLLSDSEYEAFLDNSRDSFTALWGEGKKGLPIKAITLKQALDSAKIKQLSLLFLDTEGTEDKILAKMFSDKIFPFIICVENHNKANAFASLSKHGYKKIKRLGYDDIYLKENLLEKI